MSLSSLHFEPLRAGLSPSGEKPTVRSTQKTVVFSLPRTVLEAAGFDLNGNDPFNVSVAVAKTDTGKRVVKISADTSGKWIVAAENEHKAQLLVPEIQPTEVVRKAEKLEFEGQDGHLFLALPHQWGGPKPGATSKRSRSTGRREIQQRAGEQSSAERKDN